MKIAVACVLIAGLLPLVAVAVAKWGFHHYDNHNPRVWESQLQGFRARALAAQNNSFEAFPFFASAVVFALLSDVSMQSLPYLCVTFVLARMVYVACYVMDWASARSLAWSVGYGCVLAIYALVLMAD